MKYLKNILISAVFVFALVSSAKAGAVEDPCANPDDTIISIYAHCMESSNPIRTCQDCLEITVAAYADYTDQCGWTSETKGFEELLRHILELMKDCYGK